MKRVIGSGLTVPRGCARVLATAVLASCLVVGSAAADAAGGSDQPTHAAAPIPATWAPRKLRFMYTAIQSSKTTYYSCDALQGHITSILRQLGASRDLMTRSFGCISTGPERFPGVEATFSVLVPRAAGGESSANSQQVAARWENATVNSDASCALIEQVKRQILPLFATRNASSGCPRFSVEVLRPVEPPGAQ